MGCLKLFYKRIYFFYLKHFAEIEFLCSPLDIVTGVENSLLTAYFHDHSSCPTGTTIDRGIIRLTNDIEEADVIQLPPVAYSI